MSTTISAGTATSGAALSSDTSGILQLQSGSTPTTAVTIDTSQRVGVNITPSSWGTYNVLEIGSGSASSSLAVQGGNNGATFLTGNLYNNGSNWIYKNTNAGSYYAQFVNSGIHAWFVAPSGTAGGTASLTQAMTLDNSGNLLVGTTSGSNKITVSAASGTTAVVGVSNTTSGNAAGYSSSLQTAANNTSSYHYYGSTLAVGNWYLYGNGTSSWSSDERLKHNIQTTRDGYLEDVCKLRVVKYQWKNGPQQTELGLIAQEVEQVFPGLVQDDVNKIHPDDPTLYKQLKGSVLPFMMLKAIQELSAKVTELSAKVTALEAKVGV